jgi:hypothetical protein
MPVVQPQPEHKTDLMVVAVNPSLIIEEAPQMPVVQPQPQHKADFIKP